MQERVISTWQDYCEHVERLCRSHGGVNCFQFRGHSEAAWPLDTTLDRVTTTLPTLRAYHFAISKAFPRIRSETTNSWDIPAMDDPLPGLFNENRSDDLYEFMAHLRHHGFPSPLMDWTLSPFVAAFFAFRHDKPTSHVAVFAYQEYPEVPYARPVFPHLSSSGEYLGTHRRHFLQQSVYTVCREPGSDGQQQYAKHENALNHIPGESFQKIIMPRTLRREALEYLRRHNINAFSLFGSDDSLMESLASKESLFDKF